MFYVIGSGAAGVSAAVALLAQGHEVTMLDAGNSLERERAELVRQMSEKDKGEWTAAQVSAVKDNMRSGAAGIPLKYIYGSDYPYRDGETHLPRRGSDTGLLPSYAQGGLASVWGASVLPYHASELGSWPITYEDLAPHYASVFSYMPLSGVEDGLEPQFPLYSSKFGSLPQSRQAQLFLADLDRNKEALHAKGFLFGRSRLAIKSTGCAACGLCMYGCPYGLIYNPAFTLRDLRTNPRFHYQPGVLVERFSENAGGVRIEARSLADGSALTYEGSRLFSGAGVLPTAKLFLESTQSYGQKLSVLDSQYFLLPMLRYAGAPGAAKEELHTLAQAFIEIFDERISANSVHLQVYTYNDLYRQAIQAMLRFAYPLFRPMSDAFLQRMLLIQGYLHSDLSARIELTLDKSGTLEMNGRRSPATRAALKGVVRKLRTSRSLLKAMPIGPGMKVSEPGRGFHSGGTLPMRSQPGPFETDRLGRPYGFERVHIVDSSVLPTINASTITLTVMANAHRIASDRSLS